MRECRISPCMYIGLRRFAPLLFLINRGNAPRVRYEGKRHFCVRLIFSLLPMRCD